MDRTGAVQASRIGVTIFAEVKDLPELARDLLKSLSTTAPAGRDSALTLDGIRLLLEGLKKVRSPQRDKLREALATIRELDGVTGTVTWKEQRPYGRCSWSRCPATRSDRPG